MRMAALLGANALMLVAGLGLLPLLGIARSWRLLLFRCGLAYLCGILLVGGQRGERGRRRRKTPA